MQRKIKTPRITKKQTKILLYLLKFRFLTTNHLQTLLVHKNPNRTLTWMNDLIKKDCVRLNKRPNTFIDKSLPHIYYLGPKARHLLAKERNMDIADLEYIYSEHRREESFINHCLSVADLYVFMLSQKTENEDIDFFSKFELSHYNYLPDPLPDAFISISKNENKQNYFLDIFEEYTPPYVARQRVRNYFNYAEKIDWEENTNYAPFPTVLFVFDKESLRRHIKIYGKTQFDKSYEDKVSIFLTTKNMINLRENNIWEKIE